MSIEQTPEWQLSREILEPIRAKRTGISHFQHIREGVAILQAIGAPNPRIRYLVTGLAVVAKWCKRLLSDRMVDAVFRRRFGIARET